MTRAERMNRLLRPRSLAFIGGQQVAGPIRSCREAGFTGDIQVVNPVHAQIEGLRCVPDVASLPQAPDAAVIAVAPARAIDVTASLASVGTPAAVCLASGFRETGCEGAELQARLVHAAGDMALLGPNCMGVLNLFDGAMAWGDGTLASRLHTPGCAIVSQSGAFLIGIADCEQAFPLGYAISVGNQAVVTAADCIEAALADSRVRAIGLYLEGLDDGAALARACWRAASQGVPVVVIKGGDDDAGATVALSHTAAMVVARHHWEAFRDRYGLLEVSSLKAMVETLKLFTLASQPLGRRISMLSFSGGINGQMVVRARGLGLELPPPTPPNAAALRARLPATVPIANPLDINLPFRASTGLSMQDVSALTDAMALLASGVSDLLLFCIDVPRRDARCLDEPWLPALFALAEVARRLGVPGVVAGILPDGLEPALRTRLQTAGLIPLCGFAETLEALSKAAQRANSQAGQGQCPPLLPNTPLTDECEILDEATGKSLLARHGLSVPAHRVCRPAEAVGVAQSLGLPVVVKLLSDTVVHKARVGGVKTGLKSTADVESAVLDMHRAMALQAIPFEQVLVERMVDDVTHEIILGLQRTPAMGMAMTIGLGGATVEQQASFATVLLPLVNGELERALHSLNLGGHTALATAATAMAAFASAEAGAEGRACDGPLHHTRQVEPNHCSHTSPGSNPCVRKRGSLREAEINPLLLSADGSAIAVDAVVIYNAVSTPRGTPHLRDGAGEADQHGQSTP